MTELDTLGLITIIVCHLISIHLISRPKYSRKKTILLRAIAASIVFIVDCAIFTYIDDRTLSAPLGYMFTLVVGVILFYAQSSDVFFKKSFLLFTYSQFFAIALFISGLIAHMYFDGSQLARMIIRNAIYVVAIFIYVRFVKKKFDAVSIDIITGWPPLSLVAALFFVYQSYIAVFYHFNAYEKNTVILFFLILVIVAAVYFVIFNTIRYMHTAAEKEQSELRSNFLMRQVESMQESIEEARRIRHDIRHHNTIISEYAKNGEMVALLKYLDEYREESERPQIETLCENITANNILCAYAIKARQNNIDIRFDVVMQQDIGVRDIDLVAMLANVLENCVYGCTHSNEPKQEIDVYIAQKENKLVICTRNTCEMDVDFDNGLPRSKYSGGVGVSSILHAASHYGGETDFKNENGIFVCRILLNLHE